MLKAAVSASMNKYGSLEDKICQVDIDYQQLVEWSRVQIIVYWHFFHLLDSDKGHDKVEYFEEGEWHDALNYPVKVKQNRALQISPHEIISCGGRDDSDELFDRSVCMWLSFQLLIKMQS